MNFHDPVYGLFLCVVFGLWWLVSAHRTARVLLLLAASYVFYAHWEVRYLGLIVFSTLVDYAVGARIGRLAEQGEATRAARRRLLWLSVAVNLGLLGLFKYHGFFAGNLLLLFPEASIPTLDVLLPVGISFYTFQSLSYTIDVYRGELQPARRLREFALFVAFFPQLVAGPIVRARDFLPQVPLAPRLTRSGLAIALHRITLGLAKKVLIADLLAVELVDAAFATGSDVAGSAALLAIYGYAIQIYADFSGYSDIAIGSAMLLGFRIPENFRTPYRAASIQDFWRRWHISLSTWLRDYLYVPLGGNRRGAVRTYVNLLATMLLGGLWHGAAWTFVVWGGMHGVMLAVNRWWQRRGLPWPRGPLGRALGVALTFHLVCLAWVFFRAPDFTVAVDLLGRLGHGWVWPEPSRTAWMALALGVAGHVCSATIKGGVQAWVERLPPWLIGLGVAVVLGFLDHFRTDALPFLYFQF